MKLLFANMFSVVCAGGAVAAVLMDKGGWGWLLFCGLVGIVVVKEENEKG